MNCKTSFAQNVAWFKKKKEAKEGRGWTGFSEGHRTDHRVPRLNFRAGSGSRVPSVAAILSEWQRSCSLSARAGASSPLIYTRSETAELGEEGRWGGEEVGGEKVGPAPECLTLFFFYIVSYKKQSPLSTKHVYTHENVSRKIQPCCFLFFFLLQDSDVFLKSKFCHKSQLPGVIGDTDVWHAIYRESGRGEVMKRWIRNDRQPGERHRCDRHVCNLRQEAGEALTADCSRVDARLSRPAAWFRLSYEARLSLAGGSRPGARRESSQISFAQW